MAIRMRTVRSFGYAFEGLLSIMRTQPNFALHLAAAVAALGLSVLLGLPPVEVAVVILTIAVVLAAEAANTAVEALSNRVSPGFDLLVKQAKDTAAAGVLIASLGAVGVGVVLLGPRLVRLVFGA